MGKYKSDKKKENNKKKNKPIKMPTKFTEKQKHEMTPRILKKWNEQGQFIRWIDGDSLNNFLNNLQTVSKSDALQNHFDDWTTDWFVDLTEEEIKLVENKEWRDGLFFPKITK